MTCSALLGSRTGDGPATAEHVCVSVPCDLLLVFGSCGAQSLIFKIAA